MGQIFTSFEALIRNYYNYYENISIVSKIEYK